MPFRPKCSDAQENPDSSALKHDSSPIRGLNGSPVEVLEAKVNGNDTADP
jgi:hypothetical protein